MPCRSDYMDSNSLEVELSRVTLLLRELETGKPVNSHSNDWNGYLGGVYNGGDLKKRTDEATADLCSRLQKVDATKYSPEMQIWWRDHQAADRKREAEEKTKAEQAVLRAEGLKKLTPAEIAALGLK